MGYQITLCDENSVVILTLDDADAVASKSTTWISHQTDKGGRVGMSLTKSQVLHAALNGPVFGTVGVV